VSVTLGPTHWGGWIFRNSLADMGSELQSAAAALYAARPEDFTAARDERSKAARANGDRELAAAIGRLRKPSAAAFLVNLLVTHKPGLVAEVTGLGRELSDAQQRLDGPEMRRLGRARQELIRRIGAEAASLAAEVGGGASASVLEEVTNTFQAAVTDAAAAAAVRSGQLIKALPAAVTPAQLAASVALPDLLDLREREPEEPEQARPERTPKRPSKRDSERARRQHEQAERAVNAARALLEEKARGLEAGRIRRRQLEGERDRLQQQLDEVEDSLTDLQADLRDLERERRMAQHELQDAERAAATLPAPPSE